MPDLSRFLSVFASEPCRCLLGISRPDLLTPLIASLARSAFTPGPAALSWHERVCCGDLHSLGSEVERHTVSCSHPHPRV